MRPKAAASDVAASLVECHSADSSRWATGDVEYIAANAYGDSAGEWIGKSAGVVEYDSRVYVFDNEASRVIVLDTLMRRVAGFGRKGQGPGEFYAWPSDSRARWIDADSSGLVVFDGINVQRYTHDGKYEDRLLQNPASELTWDNFKIQQADGGLLFGTGGYDLQYGPRVRNPPSFKVKRVSPSGAVDTLIEMTLAPWPVDKANVPFLTLHQSMPLWDAATQCLVASDGDHEWLIRRSMQNGTVDTMGFAGLPPARPVKTLENPHMFRNLYKGPLPLPTAMIRIYDLIIDPDGYVWLNIGEFSGKGVVLIVPMDGRPAWRDTVPDFPRSFGTPGAYYGVAADSLDVERVVRFVARPNSTNATVM